MDSLISHTTVGGGTYHSFSFIDSAYIWHPGHGISAFHIFYDESQDYVPKLIVWPCPLSRLHCCHLIKFIPDFLLPHPLVLSILSCSEVSFLVSGPPVVRFSGKDEDQTQRNELWKPYWFLQVRFFQVLQLWSIFLSYFQFLRIFNFFEIILIVYVLKLCTIFISSLN